MHPKTQKKTKIKDNSIFTGCKTSTYVKLKKEDLKEDWQLKKGQI